MKMEEDHKKAINNISAFLKEKLEPVPLADYLFSKSKITHEQHNNIKHGNKGVLEANRECLNILMNSGPDTYECFKDFLKSDTARHFILAELEHEMSEEIRVVMFGKTGVGKSSLGNNIMCQTLFTATASAQSITKQISRGERMVDHACKLILVDTPGLFDTDTKDNMETAKILASTVKECKPGPHIFIFVLTIGRFTVEERTTVEFLKDLFGVHVTDYMIIVFTRQDDLDYNKIDLKTYIDKAGNDLKSIVKQCKDVMAINNRAPDVKESVDNLVKMIKDVYLQNGKKHYTDELLMEAQKSFDEKLRKQEEEAHKKERELEAEMKQQKLEHGEIYERTRSEMNKYKSENETLDKQLKKVNEENQRMEKEKTDETNLFIEAAMSNNLKLISELESQKSQNESKINKIKQDTDNQLQKREQKIYKLKEKIKQNKTEIEQNKNELEQKANEIKQNKNELERKENEIKQNKQDIEQNKKELEKKKKEIKQNKSKLDQKENEIKLKENEIEEKENEIEKKENEIEEKEYDFKQKEIEFMAKLNEKDALVKFFQEKIREYEEKNNKACTIL